MPIDKQGKHWRVRYDDLPQQLREKLAARNLSGTRAIGFGDKLPPDIAQIGRTHPLVATLAETMAEGALDPGGVEGKATLGRTGVWMTRGVDNSPRTSSPKRPSRLAGRSDRRGHRAAGDGSGSS